MDQPDLNSSIARRHFFRDCGVGVGKIALASLLTNSISSRAFGKATLANPQAPKPSHYAPKAKAVIHLFMAGAPSQLDLFDYKPALAKYEGKPLPKEIIGNQRYAFIRPDAAALGPRFKFQKHGQSGAEISEVMPYLAQVADDICIVKSLSTDQFNHAPAQIFFNTGFSQPGRPSIGSWVNYGLGAETDDLPAFVVMSTGTGISGGAANWSSGFLPSVSSGVRLRNQGDAILNVSSPAGVDAKLQRDTLDLVGALNRRRLETEGDPEIATRISSYEMAYRLQTSAPELLDLRNETKDTLDMYGVDPAKPSFARACLLARRMVERGVRFINIYNEGWDAHNDVAGNLRNNCGKTDRGAAALIKDLKQRGLLDETLVVWGGEFGRTPMVESVPTRGTALGRDHHPRARVVAGRSGARGGRDHGDQLGDLRAYALGHLRRVAAKLRDR